MFLVYPSHIDRDRSFLGVRPSREMLFFILLSPVSAYYGGNSPVKIWFEETAARAVPGGQFTSRARS